MLPKTTLTVKNYRCFSDAHPLRFDVGDGFTAFVGPNNSGKSSILKLFYELRPVFRSRAAEQYIQGVSGAYDSVLSDPSSMFHDRNHREMSLELLVDDITTTTTPDGPVPNLTRVGLSFQRDNPSCALGFYPGGGRDEGHFTATSLNHALAQFGNTLYIGPFRNAITEGTQTYYDLDVGTAFVRRWAEWKGGPSKEKNRRILSVTEDIRTVFGIDRLEINASPDQTSLQIVIGNRPYKLDEQGAGLVQFIIALANVAIRRPSMVLIDEPELNLHPTLQIDFLTSLASYASGPVLFATHSIGLARSLADRIYSLKAHQDHSTCHDFERSPHYSELLGELSYSAFQTLGFSKVLLVEGPTEIRTIQQFLRKLHKDHEVVLLPLGGSSLIHGGAEQELAEIKRLTPNVYALVDSERESYNALPASDRRDFASCCQKLAIPVLLTQRRATENYLSDAAIKGVFGPSYSALGEWERLKDRSPRWSKNENWRIAREMSWEEIKGTDVGTFLSSL